MGLKEAIHVLITFLMVSILGYILVVIKEKLNLRSNLIVIDRKNVTQEQLDQADMKTFLIGGKLVKAGDEVILFLKGNKRIDGVLLGAKKEKKELVVFTEYDKLELCRSKDIVRFKIVSRYGRFF